MELLGTMATQTTSPITTATEATSPITTAMETASQITTVTAAIAATIQRTVSLCDFYEIIEEPIHLRRLFGCK